MTENDSDPEDEFETQLSDVGGRAREKLTESDRKKAEKLGVSPPASTADDAGDDVDRSGEPAGGELEGTDFEIDTGPEESETSEQTSTGGQTAPPESTMTTPAADDQPDEPTTVPADDTAVSPSNTGAESSEPATDSDGEQYEFRSVTAASEQPGAGGGSPAATGAVERVLAGFGSSERGERMAVTKSESSFVIGDNDATADVAERKLLYFELNDELFAGSIDSVSSVEELPGLTRYPRSPKPIDGVTDMRGKIIAVLNPKVIVSLSDSGADAPREGGEYIIVQNEREDEHRLGIRVDDISHVETVTEEDITSIHDISEMDLLSIDENYLEGIVHGYRADDEMTVPLIDFDSLTESLKEYA